MDWPAFLLYLAACAAAAAPGALFKPGAWYAGLDKPGWTPPDRAFPIVWTLLYIAIAVAAARVAAASENSVGLAFWALQITLNMLWTPVFFGLHRMRAGLVVIVALWLAVAGTLAAFLAIDVIAGFDFRALPDLGEHRDLPQLHDLPSQQARHPIRQLILRGEASL